MGLGGRNKNEINIIRNCARKSNLDILKARLTILSIVFVAICYALTFTYSFFGNALAVGNSLDEANISVDGASDIVDAISVFSEFMSDDFDSESFAEKIFLACEVIAAVSDEDMTDIVGAYFFPDEADKSILATLKYLPLASQVKELKTNFNKIGKYDIMLLIKQFGQLPQRDRYFLIEQLDSIVRGIVKNGNNELEEACKTLYDTYRAKDVLEEISYKRLYLFCEYVLKITIETDFSKLYFLDYFFGDGFSEKNGATLNNLFQILRENDFEQIVSVIEYLPDQIAFMIKLVHQIFDSEIISINDFATVLIDIVFAVKNDSSVREDRDLLKDVCWALKELSLFNADELSDAERVYAEKCVSVLISVFQ